MRIRDVVGFGLSSMMQQKARTTMNLVGVAVGTFALAVSLAIGAGIETAVILQFRKDNALRKIEVHTGFGSDDKNIPADAPRVEGKMSEERRKRIQRALTLRWQNEHDEKRLVLLTTESLEKIQKLAHVVEVLPVTNFQSRVAFSGKGLDANVASLSPDDRLNRERVVLGKAFDSRTDRGVVVSECLLYEWGFHDETSAREAIGAKLTLGGLVKQNEERRANWFLERLAGGAGLVAPEQKEAFFRTLGKLPKVIANSNLEPGERALLEDLVDFTFPIVAPEKNAEPMIELPIVGIARDPYENETKFAWGSNRSAGYSGILLPVDLAAERYKNETWNVKHQLNEASVLVDGEQNVEDVEKAIKALGFEAYSLANVIRNVRALVFLITTTMGLIAVVALFVACLGIANTMIMSVLERTREIGVLKAVGARDVEVCSIFLFEGALIGAIGACLGVFLSWLACIPGTTIIRRIVPPNVELPAADSLFRYTPLVLVGVPVLVTLISTVAALVPAIRAARVDPVKSLRHD